MTSEKAAKDEPAATFPLSPRSSSVPGIILGSSRNAQRRMQRDISGAQSPSQQSCVDLHCAPIGTHPVAFSAQIWPIQLPEQQSKGELQSSLLAAQVSAH